jgi:hypothetical protein
MIARHAALRRSLRRPFAPNLDARRAVSGTLEGMSYSRLWLVAGTLCLACGSKFEPGDTGSGSAGTTASGGSSAAGGAMTSGGASSAGAHSGGAGAGATAGAAGAGAGNGGAPSGGAPSGGAPSGGAPSGGAPSGGASSGAGGSAGAADCTALKAEYTAALEKARVCDSGSTDECSASSTLPAVGCGCPTLVNAKSDSTTIAKQKYQAIQDAKCAAGPICQIACLAYTGAACTAQAASAGTGYVCTGSQGATTN